MLTADFGAQNIKKGEENVQHDVTQIIMAQKLDHFFFILFPALYMQLNRLYHSSEMKDSNSYWFLVLELKWFLVAAIEELLSDNLLLFLENCYERYIKKNKWPETLFYWK